MTPDEREQMFALCAEIAKEKKHTRFLTLVRRLNDLLANQETRLKPSGPPAELESE
jgi:hypothetical protein